MIESLTSAAGAQPNHEVQNMFKTILHPTDFSPVALQAFDQAVALALRYGAKLQLLHAVVLHEYDNTTLKKGIKKLNEAYESLRAELKIQMEEIVEDSEIAADMCSFVIKRGFNAGEVIIDKAEESGADLIVMGTHGHSPIRHFFLGSVAEKVVRYAPCPVMVLGRMEDAPGRFQNILLPVDFSDASDRAATVALSVAKRHGARLHMLHVYQDIVPPPYYTAADSAFAWDKELKKRGEAALHKFIAKHQQEGVSTVSHLLEGRVAREIVEFSRGNSIDLIVMGTAGLSGFHHFLLGSVTEKVLRRSDIPVLTVRNQPLEEPES